MTVEIARAAVLGAGTMGAGIAALLASHGIAVDLLDLPTTELSDDDRLAGRRVDDPAVRNRLALDGIARNRDGRPPGFAMPEAAELVRPGNLVDDVGRLAEADWIIEAIAERLEPKRALLAQVDGVRRADSIVSTNTSGLSIAALADGCSDGLRAHFLGTHFFNPPRLMKLLEVIPTGETLPSVVHRVEQVGRDRLGKGIVRCKDTPNFIANRIGLYDIWSALELALTGGYTVEEVDAVAGPVLGRPRSGIFRLLDLIGIDVAVQIADNLLERVPSDESRAAVRAEPVARLLRHMLDRGWLGSKTGTGFYQPRQVDGQRAIWVLDLTTLEHRAPRPPMLDDLNDLAAIDDLPTRLGRLVASGGRGGWLAGTMLDRSLAYASRRIPEIADDVAAIDDAMRWGFGHQLGPFETWDSLGPRATLARMHQRGIVPAAWVERRLAAADQPFYAP